MNFARLNRRAKSKKSFEKAPKGRNKIAWGIAPGRDESLFIKP
jgi:hypothetical protein